MRLNHSDQKTGGPWSHTPYSRIHFSHQLSGAQNCILPPQIPDSPDEGHIHPQWEEHTHKICQTLVQAFSAISSSMLSTYTREAECRGMQTGSHTKYTNSTTAWRPNRLIFQELGNQFGSFSINLFCLKDHATLSWSHTTTGNQTCSVCPINPMYRSFPLSFLPLP